MNDDEREAARLLEPLRQPEPPTASGVDVGRAMRTGRRTVRVRQVAGTLACVVAVLGIAFAVTVPYQYSPPTKEADHEFGAATQEFAIGSAGGFTPLTYETGKFRQQATLTTDNGDTDAVVSLYPKGKLPHVDGEPWKPTGEAAPDVNGGTALWPTKPVAGDEAVELAWQWRPDAWAVVSVTGPDADRDRAHKVALSVEADADIDVKVPATFPTPAAGTVEKSAVISTLRSIGDHERSERINEVRYRVSGDDSDWITVGIREPQPDIDNPTTIDGRPALVEPNKVTFLDNTGLFVEVSAESVLDEPLTAFAARVELTSDSDWSPPPLSPTDSPTSSSATSTDSTSSAPSPTP